MGSKITTSACAATCCIFILLLPQQSIMLAQTVQPKPQAHVVQLSDTTTAYQPVFTGPPRTTTMESGLVIVQPGRSIGLHSTKGYEEAIVVFSGNGEMRIPNGRTLKLRPNSVAYCPTNTEHDIFNTGSTPLKYLYVAAKVVN